MDGKRVLILFTLIMTLSSVMGDKFSFTKAAYDEVLRIESAAGRTLQVYRDYILFSRIEAAQEMVSTVIEKRGVVLAPKSGKGIAEVSGMIGREGEIFQNPHYFQYVSLGVRKVELETEKKVFGCISICFQENASDPYETCFVGYMFSTYDTEEEQNAAKVGAVKFDPFTDTEIEKITTEKSFKWSISSLRTILQTNVKTIHDPKNLKKLGYFLRPMIVNSDILEALSTTIYPDGEVPKVGVPLQLP